MYSSDKSGIQLLNVRDGEKVEHQGSIPLWIETAQSTENTILREEAALDFAVSVQNSWSNHAIMALSVEIPESAFKQAQNLS
jgi:hypothetical protein